MGLHEYIEKLRAKPVRERERIAVIATAVGFAVIFLIWIVSFNEMNKPTEQPVDQTSASLNDLKNNFQTGKDSIQNMMQQSPASPSLGGPTGGPSQTETAGTDNAGVPLDSGSPNSGDNTSNLDSSQNIDNNQPASSSPDQKNNSVPQLP